MQKIIAIVLMLLFASNVFAETKSEKSDNYADKQTELSNIALKKHNAFRAPDKTQIKQMVAQHDFIALEKIYNGIFELNRQDVKNEGFLESAYAIFNPDNVSVNDLDLWVAQTGSYMAYAARGAYKSTAGYWARGGKYINETPQDKIDKMQQLHEEAAIDLEAAISKNPALMPAYKELIDIARASTMTFTARQILERAESHDKRTFSVRYAYMMSLLPRWGGTYEEMTKYAQEAIKYVNLNPLLWTLQGEVSADVADNLWREGNYQSAVESYTAALKFGDRTRWLKQRAICYSKLGQMDRASADANKVLYYSPNDMTARALTLPNNPLNKGSQDAYGHMIEGR